MKRFICLIFIVLYPLFNYDQARLGSTSTDILYEFDNIDYKVESGYYNDGSYYINVEQNQAIVTYFFNDDKICTQTFIKPINQGALNFYVELYNKKYVIISSTQWKMYSENGISNIELIFPKDGGYFFVWQ